MGWARARSKAEMQQLQLAVGIGVAGASRYNTRVVASLVRVARVRLLLGCRGAKVPTNPHRLYGVLQ